MGALRELGAFMPPINGKNGSLRQTSSKFLDATEEQPMAELIHEHVLRVTDGGGRAYIPRTYGEARDDGTWQGWIEFHPLLPGPPVLATGQETSQPNRTALEYWASGLEPVYFDGAFSRAG
jgi:hypothetical protein